jgi:hypothetical protein
MIRCCELDAKTGSAFQRSHSNILSVSVFVSVSLSQFADVLSMFNLQIFAIAPYQISDIRYEKAVNAHEQFILLSIRTSVSSRSSSWLFPKVWRLQ